MTSTDTEQTFFMNSKKLTGLSSTNRKTCFVTYKICICGNQMPKNSSQPRVNLETSNFREICIF
jgi:hypothetical protein